MHATSNMGRQNIKERRIPLGITFPPSLLEKIEEQRGGKSRTQFVIETLEEVLKSK